MKFHPVCKVILFWISSFYLLPCLFWNWHFVSNFFLQIYGLLVGQFMLYNYLYPEIHFFAHIEKNSVILLQNYRFVSSIIVILMCVIILQWAVFFYSYLCIMFMTVMLSLKLDSSSGFQKRQQIRKAFDYILSSVIRYCYCRLSGS